MEVICLQDEAFYALLDEVVRRVKEQHQVKEARWLTADEAMARLHIGKSTLQKLRDNGDIRFSQMERKHILYDARSLEEYVEKNVKNTF